MPARAAFAQEEAVALIVNGFCKEVLQQLPMEFAVEAQKLVGISSGRFGGLVMLEIKNLHVAVDGKEILKGLNLSHRRRRGACHHGPERLGQIHAVLCAGGPRRL